MTVASPDPPLDDVVEDDVVEAEPVSDVVEAVLLVLSLEPHPATSARAATAISAVSHFL